MNKKLILLFAFIFFPLIGKGQALNSYVGIISSGGGLIQSSSNFGSCSIGLPFVGEFGNTNFSTKLGLYVKIDTIPTTQGVKIKLAADNSLFAYPNPTTGSFTLTIPENLNHIQSFLYDERGAQILDATLLMHRSAPNRADFILKNIPTGSYMLELQSPNDRILYKLTIIK